MALKTLSLTEVASPLFLRHPVRTTALLYLREALHAENYEQCKEIIGIAKEFGAFDSDIQALLEDPRRMPKS